jgi:nitrite reductase/ring-hydroxylating ferredoxin subunit
MPMSLIKIASRSDLPAEGKVREFQAGEKMVCVACVGGRYSALDNHCLHRGGPLGQGVIEKGKVVCPWHAWEFDATTGQIGHNPAAKVATYRLTVEGDDVFVEV